MYTATTIPNARITLELGIQIIRLWEDHMAQEACYS